MKEKAGILFDYNGVIADDEHLHEQAVASTVARYGLRLTHDLFELHCLGRTDKQTMENLKSVFAELSLVSSDDLVRQKVAQYQVLIEHESIIYPGASESIQKLHQEFKLALVTGSLRIEAEPVLEKAGLKSFFEVIVTADDIVHSKPHPEGYLKSLQALGLPKEKVVVIEDSPAGVAAAKAAGLICIAVLQTVTADKLQAADKIVSRVTEITPDLVGQFINQSQYI